MPSFGSAESFSNHFDPFTCREKIFSLQRGRLEGRQKKTHHFYPLLKVISVVHYINNIFFALFSIRPFTYCIYYKSRQRCKVRLKQQCSIKKRTFKKKKMKQGNGNVNTTCHPKINYWGSFLQTSLLLSWVKGKKWLLY